MKDKVRTLSEEDILFMHKQSELNIKNIHIIHKKGLVIFVDVLGWKEIANEFPYGRVWKNESGKEAV